MDLSEKKSIFSLKSPLQSSGPNSLSDIIYSTSSIHVVKTTRIQNLAQSPSGYTFTELKNYSYTLLTISSAGLLFHLVVFFLLIYQQLKRTLIKNKNKKFLYKHLSTIFHNETNNQFQIYNNYVTYAFVFHQTLVDFLRIAYSILFANRLYFEYNKNFLFKSNSLNLEQLLAEFSSSHSYSPWQANSNIEKETIIRNLTSNSLTYHLDHFYSQYCVQMASLYSVLTMVTIVNILTILISETCRFYDLKFNSSDTSNYCCVLFGILLIWASSLIIISSLMLVGVADSAAPTWNCDLGESEATTRSLVINIVWFFLVSFIILIAFTYSISLYKELNRLDNEDNRFCLYTINASLMAVKSDFIERQIKISKLTRKRLLILICLICVFSFCFVPNFVIAVLKNTLDEVNLSMLRPFGLIASILNLCNSSFNSFVLLVLCVKSNDTYLTNVNSIRTKRKFSIRNLLLRILLPSYFEQLKMATYNVENAELNLGTTNQQNGIILSAQDNEVNECRMLNCSDECIQLKNMSNHRIQASNSDEVNQKNQKTNLKEFYSKIGNRLGQN